MIAERICTPATFTNLTWQQPTGFFDLLLLWWTGARYYEVEVVMSDLAEAGELIELDREVYRINVVMIGWADGAKFYRLLLSRDPKFDATYNKEIWL